MTPLFARILLHVHVFFFFEPKITEYRLILATTTKRVSCQPIVGFLLKGPGSSNITTDLQRTVGFQTSPMNAH